MIVAPEVAYAHHRNRLKRAEQARLAHRVVTARRARRRAERAAHRARQAEVQAALAESLL